MLGVDPITFAGIGPRFCCVQDALDIRIKMQLSGAWRIRRPRQMETEAVCNFLNRGLFAQCSQYRERSSHKKTREHMIRRDSALTTLLGSESSKVKRPTCGFVEPFKHSRRSDTILRCSLASVQAKNPLQIRNKSKEAAILWALHRTNRPVSSYLQTGPADARARRRLRPQGQSGFMDALWIVVASA